MPIDPEGATQDFDAAGVPTEAFKVTGYAGSLIKDRYYIEKELGRGGFAVVYLAKDRQLHDKLVVVKVLTQDFTEDPWTLKKFRQEIEALARIDHPGVVGALDTGETPDNKPFIVMQFVEGVTLRSLIEKGGLEVSRVANITRQIGQALSAAHDKGIWHRDLKPENIMVQKVADAEEYVKLIDFGIAAIKDSQFSPQGKQTTRVAGSFAYMSPEQFQGKPCAQSDIWAFGIIVWEMLTGKNPFAADSLFDLMIAQQKGLTARAQEVRPDLPDAAEQALVKALATEPDARYTTPREFGDAFYRGAAGVVGAAAAAGGEAGSSSAPTAPAIMVNRPATGERLDMAHVLFLDLVGYSTLPMDRQRDYLSELQQLIRETVAFREAEKAGELLRLPTGDGVALTFFGDPTAPVDCAVQLARLLRDHPHLKLRSGVHTGPVYRVADINANLNVAGGGINMAQRVMDCGDAGHILVSDVVAGVLLQLGTWRDTLTDLGEHAVKHGVKVRLYNLCTPDTGNPAVPAKLAAAKRAEEPEPSRRGLLIGAGAGIAAAAAGAAYVFWPKPGPPAVDPPKTNRDIGFYVTIQTLRNGKPYEAVRRVEKTTFASDVRLRLTFKMTQPGHLYLMNLGPKGDIGVLYPSLTLGQKSALGAGTEHSVPPGDNWFVLDSQSGNEKLYLVWAAKAVPDLEYAANGSGGETVNGQVFVRQPDKVKEILALMDKAASTTTGQFDKEQNLTRLTSPGDVLSYLLTLERI
jgi:class 3 adenylate cyclase